MLIETNTAGVSTSAPSYAAYKILRLGFIALPLLAGLDKFVHLFVNWDMYLAPRLTSLSPISGHTLMLLVGAIEMIAGLFVAVKPRMGSYVVAAWLWAIIINLLLIPGFYDIALRDFGLSLGALALAQLSREYAPGKLQKMTREIDSNENRSERQ